jgi:hypothetical protein
MRRKCETRPGSCSACPRMRKRSLSRKPSGTEVLRTVRLFDASATGWTAKRKRRPASLPAQTDRRLIRKPPCQAAPIVTTLGGLSDAATYHRSCGIATHQ